MIKKAGGSAVDLSVVVVVYNMAREAPRTLFSLSAAHQRAIGAADYEVIVVDNGSTPPLDPATIDRLQGNFRLIRIDPASPSPVAAVNRGLAEARGNVIGVMIDGARIATPGLLNFARHGARLYDRAVVATLNWHLGFDLQRFAIHAGYDKAAEDALLDRIDWRNDGYRLFEISAPAGSSVDGWMQPMAESNALFLRREAWDMLGGMDERFSAPGGGIVNLDTFRRAAELPGAEPVILLGEGTFHQLHGGIATNASRDAIGEMKSEWFAQYEAIRGRRWARPKFKNPPTYLGVLPRPALARFVRAALEPVAAKGVEPPLSRAFDRTLWSSDPPAPAADPKVNAVIDLAHTEFRAGRYASSAAVARLVRSLAPDEPEPQRLLTLTGAWLPDDHPRKDQRTAFYLALGRAHRLLGNEAKSAEAYRAALGFDADLADAHTGLAELSMPGPDYHAWLDWFHKTRSPATYVQIGVAAGSSIASARPPTVVIGIDPAPHVVKPFRTETHIFAESSAEFFGRDRLRPFLGSEPLAVGFIDGSHLYEDALKDFIALEAYCGPRSIILLHDTIPFDEVTQSRERKTQFYTGDVWKTIIALRHFRPDLDVFTIKTPMSGLTVVTGLDAESRVLADRYDEAVTRFIGTPFGAATDAALGIVANDWDAVKTRLGRRGLL